MNFHLLEKLIISSNVIDRKAVLRREIIDGKYARRLQHRKKKWSHFNLKKSKHCMVEVKFDPEFRIIVLYLSQFDSQYRINLTHIVPSFLNRRNSKSAVFQ